MLIAPIGYFVMMNFYQIPFEEDLMEKQFGKKYMDYKRKVRRWI